MKACSLLVDVWKGDQRPSRGLSGWRAELQSANFVHIVNILPYQTYECKTMISKAGSQIGAPQKPYVLHLRPVYRRRKNHIELSVRTPLDSSEMWDDTRSIVMAVQFTYPSTCLPHSYVYKKELMKVFALSVRQRTTSWLVGIWTQSLRHGVAECC